MPPPVGLGRCSSCGSGWFGFNPGSTLKHHDTSLRGHLIVTNMGGRPLGVIGELWSNSFFKQKTSTSVMAARPRSAAPWRSGPPPATVPSFWAASPIGLIRPAIIVPLGNLRPESDQEARRPGRPPSNGARPGGRSGARCPCGLFLRSPRRPRTHRPESNGLFYSGFAQPKLRRPRQAGLPWSAFLVSCSPNELRGRSFVTRRSTAYVLPEEEEETPASTSLRARHVRLPEAVLHPAPALNSLAYGGRCG